MMRVRKNRKASKDNNFVVIRDSDVVAANLRQALAEASMDARPGLEHAIALVEATAGDTETRLRARWVRSRLADVGFADDLTSVAAVKALREAEPGLSLLAAVRLRDEAVANPE
jgi:hypothetical protein